MIKSLVTAALLTAGLSGYALAQSTVTGAPETQKPLSATQHHVHHHVVHHVHHLHHVHTASNMHHHHMAAPAPAGGGAPAGGQPQ